MKAFGQLTRWQGRLLAGLVAVAVVGGAARAWSVPPLILTGSHANAVSSSNAGTNANAQAYLYSPGLSDILQMVKANVDPGVVIAYIKNSPVPYSPSPAEIIALKERGVSPDIVTALLQRGGQLRAQEAQAMQMGPPPEPYPGATTPETAAPPYPYNYGADYGLYPGTYDAGYPYSPYGYFPGNYWWYTSFWPWWFSPGFGFDSFDHHHHHGDFDHFNRFNRFNHFNHFNDFNRFNRFNRFNNFNHARFQSFSSSPFNNARFQNFDFNQFNRRGLVTPRTGISHLGVPSRANAPGAFAQGIAPGAFIGARGGSAGMIRPPGVAGGMRGGGFAFRGGGGFHGGGFHGGGHGGGGGHR